MSATSNVAWKGRWEASASRERRCETYEKRASNELRTVPTDKSAGRQSETVPCWCRSGRCRCNRWTHTVATNAMLATAVPGTRHLDLLSGRGDPDMAKEVEQAMLAIDVDLRRE